MGGIQIRGKKRSIRVFFVYRGVRRFEPTKYACETGKTGCRCSGCRSATSIAAEIDRKITEGIFNYAEFFPNSKALNTLNTASEKTTFEHYAKRWLLLKERILAFSTYKTYTSATNKLIDYFKNYAISEIKPTDIQQYIATTNLSPKSISNVIGVLHQILNSALHDDIIHKNPAKLIKKPAIASTQIDPFDIEEIEKIIDWVQKHHPKMTILFALGFYTGMRTGELLALKWSDIDFNKHTITVRRTITKNRIKESTKTKEYRVIDIIPTLDRYINKHKQYTYMQSEWVITTAQGNPYMKTENINRLYYVTCLKTLGIRYRTLYQMRHSFACVMITAGEDLNWIKNMLGHATLEMINRRYGNMITRRDGTRKGAAFEAKRAKNVPIRKKQLKTIDK